MLRGLSWLIVTAGDGIANNTLSWKRNPSISRWKHVKNAFVGSVFCEVSCKPVLDLWSVIVTLCLVQSNDITSVYPITTSCAIFSFEKGCQKTCFTCLTVCSNIITAYLLRVQWAITSQTLNFGLMKLLWTSINYKLLIH